MSLLSPSAVSEAIKLNVTKDVSSSVSGTLAPDHKISGALTSTPRWSKCEGNNLFDETKSSGDATDIGQDDGCITLELRLRSDSGMSATIENKNNSDLDCAEVKACKGERACQISRQPDNSKFIPALELKPGDIHCFLHDQNVTGGFADASEYTLDLTNSLKDENGNVIDATKSKSSYKFKVDASDLEK
jgi:hypothetical protein